MRQIIQVDPVFEDSGGYLLARVYGASGALLLNVNVSTLVLIRTEIGGTPDAPVNLTPVTDYVFDVLQLDNLWTVGDGIGYNFKYQFTPAQVPTGAKIVQFEFKVTPPSGPIFHIVFKVPVTPLLGS